MEENCQELEGQEIIKKSFQNLEGQTLKELILYYFTDLGILMYGEFMLNNSHQNLSNYISGNYLNFLKDENIKSSILSVINHTVCSLFYQTKISPSCKDQIIIILSKLNNSLQINYYNFFLICNLIHYYNEYLDISEGKSLFLIKQLKKFSNLIINNEKDINEEDDSNSSVLLFFYYYSILLYCIYKNRRYEGPKCYAEKFKEYIEQKVNNLFNNNYDDIYRFKYNNNYINLYLDNIIDNPEEYEKNQKFQYYIKFIKYYLSIIEQRKDQKIDFNFSFYKDNKLTKDIEVGLLYKKLLFLIINYDEKDMDIFEQTIKNFEKENININNENINRNIINNSNDNINNIENEYNENNNNINEDNIINDENNIINNNIENIENNDISSKIEYIKAIIRANKNLMRYDLLNFDKYEEKIKIDINSIKNLSMNHQHEQELYHNYNISIIEKRDFNEESLNDNIFLYIIYYHNKIVMLSKEYIHEKKSEKRDNILELCHQFSTKLKELKNQNDKKDFNFIKNNNYLKIIITRVFYNYLELIFIDVKKNINNDEHYEEIFKEFEDIILDYDINNNLINKIKGDYYFITKNLVEAEKFYEEYSVQSKNEIIQGLFGLSISSYIKEKKNEVEEGNLNFKAINNMENVRNKIQKDLFLIKNNISLLPELDKIISKFKE